MNIKIYKTKIDDVLIFQPKKFIDYRGHLIESYNKKFYEKYLANNNFIQENESKSNYGVLRGLHYQEEPFSQAKLVRVVKGVIQDVAVDLRRNSKTYLNHISEILDDKNKKQLYIPRGFAHGFLVLSKEAIVSYKMDNYYDLNSNKGIKYDDPKINIKWNLDPKDIILSNKDKNWINLEF